MQRPEDLHHSINLGRKALGFHCIIELQIF
jgi:hypothetical protein